MCKELLDVSAAISNFFTKRGISLSAAESCTGGCVASSIVSIEHASAFFKGSAVCYCDRSKIDILKVSSKTIEEFCAESSECALEMSRGAAEVYKSDASVSTTGFLDGNVGGKSPLKSNKVFISVFFKGAQEVYEISLQPIMERNHKRELVSCIALSQLLKFVKKQLGQSVADS